MHTGVQTNLKRLEIPFKLTPALSLHTIFVNCAILSQFVVVVGEFAFFFFTAVFVTASSIAFVFVVVLVVTSFLNMFTNVNNMNNSDDDLGVGFDEESNNDSAAAKHPYPELIPTLVSITKLVQTAGDLAFVRKEMNQIYSVLLSRKHEAGPAGNIVSFPEVDQQRKDKRMKPMELLNYRY
jgi:hypothetical protein